MVVVVMPMPYEWYEEYQDMVNMVASKWAYSYSEYVDKEDVTQELWLWFGVKESNVQRWRDDETLTSKNVDSLVYRSLANAAYDYCLKEKMAKMGASVDDLFWYAPSFIKTMLPGVLLNDWKRIHDLAEGSVSNSFKDVSERGDWMSYTSDIRKAFDHLSEEEKFLVLEFYGKDQNSKIVAKKAQEAYAEARTPKALHMVANRAVVKMSKFLGGMPPKVMD
jgi:hypothetical protein